jgi:hypothetical protein
MEVIDPPDYYEDSLYKKWINKKQLKTAKKFTDLAKESIDKAVDGMNKEADETREMGIAFFRMLNQKLRLNEREDPPTEEEVKEAIEQLKDIGRISVFASVSILPGGAVSLVGLELLARKFGINDFTLIPSSFRKPQKNKQQTCK